MRFDVGSHGKTSGAVYRAAEPIGATFILAHGAGTSRTHPLVVDLAKRIAALGVDVFTFNFLYSEAGRRLPDRPEVLEACWIAAIAKIRARTGLESSPLFIGGRSMGGRFATRIASLKEGLVLDGVVCIGYPLHPNGKPQVVRDEILSVDVPLIVVQGTKDELGSAVEMKKFLARRANMRVHPIEGADHSFGKVEHLEQAAGIISRFIARRVVRGSRR
ncbi:MAG: alpha/beta family hydrolase [Labilithrix sp.]